MNVDNLLGQSFFFLLNINKPKIWIIRRKQLKNLIKRKLISYQPSHDIQQVRYYYNPV